MRFTSLTAAVCLSLASAASADEAAPGFLIEDLPGLGTSVTLSNGDYVTVGGYGIWRYAEDGTFLEVLHSYSNFLFGTAIAVDPTETFVVASRDDGIWSDIYRVDLAGGPGTFLAYPYLSDIVIEDQNTALIVTAASNWIYRLDLNTGNYDPKSDPLTGSVHAIALDAAGNLYVAHGAYFDAYIERFDAAQVAGPGLLSLGGGGTLLYHGLEFVSALQVTPSGSAIYVAENPSPDYRIAELRASSSRVLVTASDAVRKLQLMAPSQPAQYLAGQPAFGGYLVYQPSPGGGSLSRKALLPTRRAFPVR